MRRPAGWLVALVFVVGLALLLASILVVPRLLHPPLSAADLRGIASADKRVELQQAQAKLQNDARATLLQGAAGLLLVAGAVATWRQLGISREQLEVVRQQALESDRQAREQLAVIREGQITDRFTRAIEQLGSDKLEVRLGGIFALERIAKDSEPDRWAIADSLVAFVRTHAPWRAGAPESQDPHPTPTIDERLPWLAERALDVQEAVRVLGRRPPTGEQRQLQLPRVDLRRTWLVGAQLANTALRNTNLAQSWLVEAHLEDSDLVRADLRRVNAKGRTSADRTCARPTLVRRTFMALAWSRQTSSVPRCVRRTCVVPICTGRACVTPTCVTPTCVGLTCAARTWREQR